MTEERETTGVSTRLGVDAVGRSRPARSSITGSAVDAPGVAVQRRCHGDDPRVDRGLRRGSLPRRPPEVRA